VSEAHWLFCYGTLREARVQHRVFGRVVGGLRDALDGFELGAISVDGARYRAVRPGGGGRVEGLALRLTEQDLPNADAYETDAYKRVEVRLVSGRRAFVYIAAS
jgi:gamma-glutamylcyclotransferase (GGCT)/AIG2-like uncharacterized protein YtfP